MKKPQIKVTFKRVGETPLCAGEYQLHSITGAVNARNSTTIFRVKDFLTEGQVQSLVDNREYLVSVIK